MYQGGENKNRSGLPPQISTVYLDPLRHQAVIKCACGYDDDDDNGDDYDDAGAMKTNMQTEMMQTSGAMGNPKLALQHF